MANRTAAAPKSIYYPMSDGKPIADDTLQFEWIVKLYNGLAIQFADASDVFIASNLIWYPVEGQPRIRTAPDVMVALGRPKGYRSSYLQWQERMRQERDLERARYDALRHELRARGIDPDQL